MASFDVDADRHVLALSRSLRAGTYTPRPPSLHVIRDPKVRLIAAPAIADRIVHHALLADIGPTFERSFVDASFAWGTGRGTHRAVLRALASTRRFAFRLSLDIRRYFPSIRHDTLIELLCRRLRDADTRALVTTLVRDGGAVYRDPLAIEALALETAPVPPGAGMPIGSYRGRTWAIA